MKYQVTIGIACMVRHTYDVAAAKEIFEAKKKQIKGIENVNWVIIEEPVVEVVDAEAAAAVFNKNSVDAVVLLSGTFHLGHLVLVFEKLIDKPKFLWGFNELPYNGGKIRLNTVCAVNLNSSNLYKAGNDTFVCNIGDDMDEAWIDAIRIKTVLKKAKFGYLGFRAHGFFNLSIDELSHYKDTGVMIDYFDMREGYEQEVSEDELKESIAHTKKLFVCATLTEDQVEKVSRLTCSLRKFMDKNKLDAVAVRCWPEYAAQYGISPCAAMSILQAEGYILSCEGDIQGAMSMLACKAIGVKSPYLADLSQIDFENNFALMWHCGVAPADLWDGICERSLDTYFAGGKGVTADFVMKSGMVNAFRIDTARGKTRIFLQKGEAIPMEKLLKGTYAKVVFERNTRELIDIVTSTGVAHHVAMAYGDYTQVFKYLSRIMGWEVIQ